MRLDSLDGFREGLQSSWTAENPEPEDRKTS